MNTYFCTQPTVAFSLKRARYRRFSSTKCSSNKGFSGNSSILPRSNFGVSGQFCRPQSLTAATLGRYAQVYHDKTKRMKYKEIAEIIVGLKNADLELRDKPAIPLQESLIVK